MPRRLSRAEFVALMAMLFATIAFSIDAMLPALPEIADELTPDAPNRAQLIITSFVLGMGIGTLFTGPLSDAYGRKPVIIGGAVIYIIASGLAWAANSLELMLAARVLQGLGVAGPRVVALAIVRDLYEGRGMAQLMSFVMMVFTLVPAVAPAIGAGIIAVAGWRAIFAAFVLFSLISVGWLALRQEETLPIEKRRPFKLTVLAAGVSEVVRNRQVMLTIVVIGLSFGILFSTLVSTQPVFDVLFDRGDTFHWWFALIALIAALGSVLNARIVMQLGMRRVASLSFFAQGFAAAAMLLVAAMAQWQAPWAFGFYVGWTASVFFMAGLTIGNLNALALVPMGHIAGMAASIVGAISTIGGVAIAAPVGLAFDGTPLPAALGVLICTTVAYLITRQLGDPAPTPVMERT
ncbi:MAG: multidrug effflux MFS transporter [Alphaproteobacteria bacterium]|nr:multidrug effflux MFS transporter [Alphaproteobacteria bacterium]